MPLDPSKTVAYQQAPEVDKQLFWKDLVASEVTLLSSFTKKLFLPKRGRRTTLHHRRTSSSNSPWTTKIMHSSLKFQRLFVPYYSAAFCKNPATLNFKVLCLNMSGKTLNNGSLETISDVSDSNKSDTFIIIYHNSSCRVFAKCDVMIPTVFAVDKEGERYTGSIAG